MMRTELMRVEKLLQTFANWAASECLVAQGVSYHYGDLQERYERWQLSPLRSASVPHSMKKRCTRKSDNIAGSASHPISSR